MTNATDLKIADFSGAVEKRLSKGSSFPLAPDDEDKFSEANRDPGYESSDGISAILSAIRDKAPLILVSGRAGTGKSRLIRYLSSIPEGRRQMVVAPTGIAALNIGASTIHSAFRLPFGPINVDDMPKRRLGAELRKIDRLIIDEISMVRADTLDAIDACLRRLRRDEAPFGGVQVMMIGDFLQLPPVVKREEEDILARLGYATPFAFSARVVQKLPLRAITLKKVWRQSDPEFIEMLGRIREARAPETAVEWLNARCHRAARDGTSPMLLTPTRAAADRYNAEGLEAQRAVRRAACGAAPRARGADIGEIRFTGKRKGTFEASNQLPVPEHQDLLPGVRVMAVKNDMGGKFVNGSLGTILEVDAGDEETPPFARVLFDGKAEAVRVGTVIWEDIRHGWNEASDSIEKTVVGSYDQIPLVLGYATTIHKSQGLTLDDLRIDLGRGAFAAGQLYVALSRASSLSGLSLVRPINMRDVQVDEMLTAFLTWVQKDANIELSVANG